MSSTSAQLAALFRRDLTRLLEELRAFPDDATFWKTVPGVTNPAGNLVLHLEGNLRDYIGRELGGVAYQRDRPREFSATGLTAADLIARMEAVRELIPTVIAALSEAQLDAEYPQTIIAIPAPTRQCLFSLYAHLSYHTGQIDYLRRMLTQGGAVQFSTLK